jgi:hypothetical protein
MTKRAIHRAAAKAAEMLTNLVTPLLLRDERRLYFQEAYRICRGLIESCQRQAGRERMRLRASMN